MGQLFSRNSGNHARLALIPEWSHLFLIPCQTETFRVNCANLHKFKEGGTVFFCCLGCWRCKLLFWVNQKCSLISVCHAHATQRLLCGCQVRVWVSPTGLLSELPLQRWKRKQCFDLKSRNRKQLWSSPVVIHFYLVHHRVNLMAGIWLCTACWCTLNELNLRRLRQGSSGVRAVEINQFYI